MIRKLNQFILFRYLVSGGTSASIDLAVLYLFNSVLGMHYLLAATLAFAIAFCFSFVLQKFWTFRHRSTVQMHRQVAMYLASSLIGLSLNTILMYVFVDHLHQKVFLSQVFAGGLVACCTFFISRHIVFKKKDGEEKQELPPIDRF